MQYQQDSQITLIDPRTVRVDRNLNVRLNYDLPSMKDSILQLGRITDAIMVDKDLGVVLKGNRRTLAAQELLDDPNTPESVKEALVKTPCIFVSGLDSATRIQLVIDQGAQLSLNREEIIMTVWRLHDAMYDAASIGILLYHQIAQLTGNLKKAKEVAQIKSKSDREKAIRKWLKGTLDDYLLSAAKMGPEVKNQVILTEAKSERKLTDEEEKRFKWTATRERVNALRTAKTADVQEGKWSVEQGGPRFNEKLADFIKEETGQGGTPDAKKRPKASELKDKATELVSKSLKDVLNMAAGERPDNFNIADIDRNIMRFEFITEELEKILQEGSLKHPKLVSLVKALAHQDHGAVRTALVDLDDELLPKKKGK